MLKVFIVGGGINYETMFEDMGWEITEQIDDADLVQFTGGSDVSPHLYGEETHPRTHSSLLRDTGEIKVYEDCLRQGKPMAGICRGGQFLHVMSGGKLWQHIPGHAIMHTHSAWSYDKETVLHVTSTHHQAMRYSKDVGEVLLWAAAHGAHQHMSDGMVVAVEVTHNVESVYHMESKSFCYQPHPEFEQGECREYYFDKLLELFGLWA